MIDRRRFLSSAGAFGAAQALPFGVSAQPKPPGAAAMQAQLMAPHAFDYAWLKGQARALAGVPHAAPGKALPPALANLSWDKHQAIRFKREQALWFKESAAFRLQFFHLGRNYTEPVQMHEIVDGQARLIEYRPDMFDFSASGLNPRRLPASLGFAGFRVHFENDWDQDIAAFLGASYFRAVGEDRQYGLSARGLAIDTGLSRPEEFPAFTHYWFERPPDAWTRRLVIYALMDSASVTGAYRFELTPGEPLSMEIDAALYPRRAIERLGIAPLTSMYQVGENDRREGAAGDWRPEIHDSDGLALWTGAGERIWRPLVNPAGLRVNSYVDDNPRGFGLLQRDRNFDHYQDDGVFYDRRPSVWIEPKPLFTSTGTQGWGKGAVQLVEAPTPGETLDNIVAYWNPAVKALPGQELLYAYRLHWGSQAPYAASTAFVAATRTGIGGVVGQPRAYFSWRFVVDFAGGELAELGKREVTPVITASRGAVELASARILPQSRGYRAMFDLQPTDTSTEPVDLRLYLRDGVKVLSETWLYQWTPPPAAERKKWLTG